MSVWSIADLHLSLGVPNKEMGIFGPHWQDHIKKIEAGWLSVVKPEDLVLIPGDISWAMEPPEAVPDLNWIHQLPGTKLLLKGNHDYWWGSLAKVKAILPPSCHIIQNNSFLWNGIAIGGTRLWDAPGLNFDALPPIDSGGKPDPTTGEHLDDESRKIFTRELGRLEASLKTLDSKAHTRIAMTHYPPIGPELQETEATKLLEKYGINICVFGHLHNIKQGLQVFGKLHDIQYHLTACDFLNFTPLRVI